MLFWFRFASPISSATSSFFTNLNTESLNAFLAAQANQYAMLQTILVVFSIFIAILAFWGYHELKTIVESRTQQTLKDNVPDLLYEYFDKEGGIEKLEQIYSQKKLNKATKKNEKEVFRNGLQTMLDTEDQI